MTTTILSMIRILEKYVEMKPYLQSLAQYHNHSKQSVEAVNPICTTLIRALENLALQHNKVYTLWKWAGKYQVPWLGTIRGTQQTIRKLKRKDNNPQKSNQHKGNENKILRGKRKILFGESFSNTQKESRWSTGEALFHQMKSLPLWRNLVPVIPDKRPIPVRITSRVETNNWIPNKQFSKNKNIPSAQSLATWDALRLRNTSNLTPILHKNNNPVLRKFLPSILLLNANQSVTKLMNSR